MIPGSVLLECDEAGHMVILERHGQVNAALDQLLVRGRRASRDAVTTSDAHVEVKPVGAEEVRVVHAVVHAAFEARPPLDPPAAALAETLEELEARLSRARRTAGPGGR